MLANAANRLKLARAVHSFAPMKWALLFLLGCTRMAPGACEILCNEDSCPAGLTCRSDGFCHGEDATVCARFTWPIDAAAPIDGWPPCPEGSDAGSGELVCARSWSAATVAGVAVDSDHNVVVAGRNSLTDTNSYITWLDRRGLPADRVELAGVAEAMAAGDDVIVAGPGFVTAARAGWRVRFEQWTAVGLAVAPGGDALVAAIASELVVTRLGATDGHRAWETRLGAGFACRPRVFVRDRVEVVCSHRHAPGQRAAVVIVALDPETGDALDVHTITSDLEDLTFGRGAAAEVGGDLLLSVETGTGAAIVGWDGDALVVAHTVGQAAPDALADGLVGFADGPGALTIDSRSLEPLGGALVAGLQGWTDGLFVAARHLGLAADANGTAVVGFDDGHGHAYLVRIGR